MALVDYLEKPATEGSAIDAILDAVRTHLGMEIAFASRIANGRRAFTHIRADIPLPLGPGDSEPLEDTLCQRVLDGRVPALCHAATELPAACEAPITLMLPVGSHLNVPLILSDGSLYGTFCCVSRASDRTLGPRDMETLGAFAALAAREIEREGRAAATLDASRTEILRTIGRGLPLVHLQPIHRIDDGSIVGVEALSRFPDHGARCPSAWFAQAAAAGLGPELEFAAIRAAIAALAYVPAPAYLSLNLSPDTLFDPALAPLLATAPPGRLVIEITEHARVASYPNVRAQLALLRPHARVAVDDVGAGYAGLCHILDLQPDMLKLDMSLTRDVGSDLARQALIAAMVDFAGQVDCTVIAEGVETEGERAMLRRLGVPFAQGWLFSRAMPPVTAQQMLLGAMEEARPVAVGKRARAA